MASGAAVLLTVDSGFTGLAEAVLDTLPYEVHHPDSFFLLVDAVSSAAARRVVREQLDYWYARDGAVDLSARLRDSGCPDFARKVAEHVRALEWTPPENET